MQAPPPPYRCTTPTANCARSSASPSPSKAIYLQPSSSGSAAPLQRCPKPMPEVERVGAPPHRNGTDELARRLDQLDLPLLIAGGAAAWPAVARWNAPYLAERFGSIEVAFKMSSGNAHPDFRASGLARMFAR